MVLMTIILLYLLKSRSKERLFVFIRLSKKAIPLAELFFNHERFRFFRSLQ